jgi:hypothetical protein
MREAHISWNAQSVANSDYSSIANIATKLEVVAHLAVSEKGVRQLIIPTFKDGMGPDDLKDISFLEIEDSNFGSEGGAHIIAWNTHPLSVAAIEFHDIHIIPPYSFGGDGMEITVRGVPLGISKFLKTCNVFLPPDRVKVVEMVDEEDQLEQLLTEKQIECIITACSVGYYHTPKKTSLRQLSENMNIPRSTLQEHLSRAEANLMNWAADSLRKQ